MVCASFDDCSSIDLFLFEIKKGVNICLIVGVVLYAFAWICNNCFIIVQNTP